ncbi:MAG: endonuclease III [Flavobacteriales bacterium]|nr:endonuclease III [Flavobacteriales bacterium]
MKLLYSKKERAAIVVKTLGELYPHPDIPLQHADAFTLLVAVVLSAQCTDERVNKITPLLFARADNPADMALLPVEEIASIIRPCGLSPAKSKAIKGLSAIIAERYEGRVPDNFEALESLPGVGHKTASVVMSQVFGIPAFPVDTHIHRLMYRWGLSDGKSVEVTERDAKRLFLRELWNTLHLQIIYYGRQYSPARGFRPDAAPIEQQIGWREK